MMEYRLTIYFDDPFWTGVFERIEDGHLSAAKVTFGAEPKDCAVWEFILRHYDELKFSPAIKAERKKTPIIPSGGSETSKSSLRLPALGQNHSRPLPHSGRN